MLCVTEDPGLFYSLSILAGWKGALFKGQGTPTSQGTEFLSRQQQTVLSIGALYPGGCIARLPAEVLWDAWPPLQTSIWSHVYMVASRQILSASIIAAFQLER